MKKVTLFVVLALLFVMSMGVQAQGTSRTYMVIANGNLPTNFEAQVAAAGGIITIRIPQIGVYGVESANPNFASRISGVQSVTLSAIVTGEEPVAVQSVEANNAIELGPDYNGFLWGLNDVDAPEAWAAGVDGSGVRVAVLDGGFDLDHPDINFDVASGASFVPGQDLSFVPSRAPARAAYASHATHVSGTIAALDNGFGVTGVAPGATIVPVKVLADAGSGDFLWVLAGIIYAAQQDVDVMNMSLGLLYVQGSGQGTNGLSAYRQAYNRAMNFAAQQGVTVVVSAGNDGVDLNNPNSFRRYVEELFGLEEGEWHPASILDFMGGFPNVISISSLGPTGAAFVEDPGTTPYDDLDTTIPAYYTTYGPAIDFSAPGGNVAFQYGNAIFNTCTVTVDGVSLTDLCYRFDWVLSTGNVIDGHIGYYWSQGTSMASPHAAGVAALMVDLLGGNANPSHVIREMRSRATDLGKAGSDDIYGWGRVNSGF